jgi:phosphatidylserine/phosphatidylglycerophosphate/cardiolipin synthase-like enzyme
VAMYDFTSGDILQTLLGVITKKRLPLRMVQDHPALNPTANQSDEQTVAAITRSDGDATIMWALTQTDPDTTKWIFPSAYHIKVAVRDSSAFWLSSGNWNVSNQPNLAAQTPSRGSLANADRDWHVVVMDAGLAKLFEAYIEHDFTVASGVQADKDVLQQQLKAAIGAAVKTHQLEQKAHPLAPVKSRGVPFTLGRPKVFTKARVTVQPLLTPDRGKNTTMYVDNVLALITSARKRLYIQTQYVHPTPLPADRSFMLLVTAVAAAVKRGVDVRLIASQYENTPQYVELMHEHGLSGVLRVQDRVHNKGIVVDSKTVLVSSQNWSSAGVLQNRDAGVIIGHPGIAQYYEANFLQDWEDRADVRVKGT